MPTVRGVFGGTGKRVCRYPGRICRGVRGPGMVAMDARVRLTRVSKPDGLMAKAAGFAVGAQPGAKTDETRHPDPASMVEPPR